MDTQLIAHTLRMRALAANGRRVAAIRGENKAFCLVVLGCFVCGYNQLLRNMMQEIINIAGGSKNDVSKIKHS